MTSQSTWKRPNDSGRSSDLATTNRTTEARYSGALRTAGFTLVELVVVVAILSIAALVAIPSLAPTQPYRVHLAASEVSEAFRHARSEALRMGNPYGVNTEAPAGRTRVFRGQPGTMPPTPVYDALHPLTKKAYELLLGTNSTTEGVVLTKSATWSGACSQPDLIGFDARGIPHCGSPWNVLLVTATLTFTYAGHTQTVLVEGETGRVSLQ